MKNQYIIILAILIVVIACIQQKIKDPDFRSEKALSEWFNKGEWKQGWVSRADESINQKEFARLYYKNPDRWNKAFRFLREQNLAELESGRYELEDSNLFVKVDKYVSRNEENVLFEAHKKYADIQIVISGEEKIGVLPLASTTIKIPYDEKRDIMFLSSDTDNYRNAEPGKFFLFFPGDAHRPTVKVTENLQVKKVVIKIRI